MEQFALPKKLYNIAQIRLIEKQAPSKFQLAEGELMERAGYAAFYLLKELWPAARHIVIAAGPGNNGGDGYVLARLAHQENYAVRVLTVSDPNDLKGDALAAYQAASEAGVLISSWNADDLLMADVIVDALLGIGAKRQLSKELADAIADINDAASPVLAIDIPSGLCADTGRVFDNAVQAEATVTFLAMKCGLCTGAAAEYRGQMYFSDLGVSEESYEKIPPTAYRMDEQEVMTLLPPRNRVSHKNDFGHVLVIGGDYGFAGAAGMAAMAALRTGAGLVSVATRPEHVPALVALHPEIMAHGVTRAEELEALIARVNVIILGPGLGRSEWSHALWLKAIATHLPMLVDADGLNWLAEDPHVSREWILTPHVGEAARLLKSDKETIQRDRFMAAKDLQHEYGGVAVLKGSGTIVQSQDAAPSVCIAGNPGMATGGMGDILSGVIGGLLAQKLPLAQAAQLGVYAHSLAADLAAREGERGMIATDLLPYIRQLINPL